MHFIHHLRGRPWTMLVVVMIALFTDMFLYGVIVPLAGELNPTGDEAELAVMYGGYALGLMLATPIFGILSDMLGRRWPIIWGVSGQIGAICLFAVAGGSFGVLMLARVAQGVAASATWTAALALVAQTYTKRRTAMMGLAVVGGNAGSVLGPLLGGVLLTWGGVHLALSCAALFLCITLLLCLVLLVEPPRQPGKRPDLLGLIRDPAVLVAGWVVIVCVAGWGSLEPLLPNHLKKTEAVAPWAVGLMFATATFCYCLAIPWVQRAVERWGLRPTMAVGLTLMALSLPLVALPGGPVMAGAALTLVSVWFAFALNPCYTELAEAVDRRGTGGYASVYAVFNIAYGIGMIGSDAAAGFLTAHVSFLAALVGTAIVILASVPVLFLGRNRAASGEAAKEMALLVSTETHKSSGEIS